MPSSEFAPLLAETGAADQRGFRPLRLPAPGSPQQAIPAAVEAAAEIEEMRPPRPQEDAENPLPAQDRTPPAGVPLEETAAWQAGFAAGQAAAAAAREAGEAALARSLEELAAFQRSLRRRYERELLQVALGVARKVVQQEIQERPEIWLGMIRAAVRQAVEREHIVVRVPPPLAQALQARLASLRAGLEDVKELEIVEDPALPPGGCVVESRWGEVDIGIESQLAAAEQALLCAED